jgi:hypothetical protein
VVVYRYLTCVVHCLDLGMINFLSKTGKIHEEFDLERPVRPVGWNLVKSIRSFAATNYCLGLFLMLVAMAMNPALFLALFVGYWAGEQLLCDFNIDLTMHKTKPLYANGGLVGSLLRFAFCLPAAQIPLVRSALYAPLSTSETEKPVETFAQNSLLKSLLWYTPRVLSLIYLIVMLVWVVEAEGGFGYTATTVFGWHPLLMSFFVVMFTNEAILTYKAPLLVQMVNDRTVLRFYHSMCHLLSIGCITFGLISIANYKTWSTDDMMPTTIFPFYTMYSPHSWLGILTVTVFGIQLLFALVLFYLVQWSAATKKVLVDVHHFTGHMMYALGLATCITGFQDMQSSDLAAADMLMATMVNGTMVMMYPNGHDDAAAYAGGASGYLPDSMLSNLSAACGILLFLLGVSTFAALKYLPKTTPPIDSLLVNADIVEPMMTQKSAGYKEDGEEASFGMNNAAYAANDENKDT